MVKRTQILLADSLSKSEQFLWEQNTSIGITTLSSGGEKDNEFMSFLEDTKILITNKREITRKILRAGKSLILVQKIGSVPFNIDLESCKSIGIGVATWPMLSRIAVAEHTVALMLSCAKQIIKGHMTTKKADYRKLGKTPLNTSEDVIAFNWMNLPLEDLYSKTIGLVGFGEIALEVAIRVKAFGMKVIYYKRTRLNKKWEKFLNITYKPLNQLLQMADFVSLHVPLTRETTGLIGVNELNLMKKSAFLINTSRGSVIDEDALVKALINFQIAGAGLDVFDLEPLPIDNPLRNLDNVILTPHVGGGTGGGKIADIQRLLENINMVITADSIPKNLLLGYEGTWSR